MEDVAYARWEVLESVRRDDHRAVEWGGEPKMKGVVGNAGKGDESTSDYGKIAS